MAKISDLKSTLNLPKTDFPMKAKLPEREPEQLAAWEQTRLYDRILESRKNAPLYVLHDGPPYPTGEIHLGTGLNKILKDMIVKSKTMAGFRSPYIPGWDCHGLPIETKVEKEIGGKTDKIPVAEFRKMCRAFAARYIDSHRREFKRLGIFGRWDKPYLTMDPSMEAQIAGAFIDFFEAGYVYRGLKPVYWCIFDRTALAEAEVEYGNHTSPSVWVKFPVVGDAKSQKLGDGVSALAWTTTPWTLPANRALAFHPEFEYVIVDTAAGRLLLAKDRVNDALAELGLEAASTSGGWKGRELEGIQFRHPFLDRAGPAVLADYVTLDQGSGIVHTAPGHGAEDFYTGQKYGLEPYAPQDDDGRFTEGLAEYKGKTVFEANAPIVELLRQRGMLVGERKFTHSYPHCWRCHNPVIFRATEQWFIHMDAGTANIPPPQKPPLRQRALEEIGKVKWLPEWGSERMREMVAERPDWCISRQRFWGVPLIVYYCDACGTQLKDFKALRNVLPFFEREGADAWYTHPAEELLPPGTKCSGCGSTNWRKETDILDVWFESGSTHLGVLTKENGLHWPAEVYLEGPDQFRGWFQSSLLNGVGTRGGSPYRQVVTHGWTLDEKGAPMSKSLGNAMVPNEITEKWGADLLRIWVVSQDYTADMRNSPAMMQQLSEAYRKIRNTFRFALSNLYDFDPARDSVADSELWEMDAWMLRRTGELVRECREWYDGFEFHRVYHRLHDFCTVDLSALYFDILKDRLYTFAPKNPGRRSAQTAIYRIASALLTLIAPTLVFTAEEVWKHILKPASQPESVHMALFPSAKDFTSALDDKRSADWDRLLAVREEVIKALEPARAAKLISSGLEARVTLTSDKSDLVALLKKHAPSLPGFFIVSQVEIADGGTKDGSTAAASIEGLTIRVERAQGAKCERCWNYSTHVGENADYPTVCERCVAALREIEGQSTTGSAGS